MKLPYLLVGTFLAQTLAFFFFVLRPWHPCRSARPGSSRVGSAVNARTAESAAATSAEAKKEDYADVEDHIRDEEEEEEEAQVRGFYIFLKKEKKTAK